MRRLKGRHEDIERRREQVDSPRLFFRCTCKVIRARSELSQVPGLP